MSASQSLDDNKSFSLSVRQSLTQHLGQTASQSISQSVTGVPSLVLLKQSFLIAFKQSFLSLYCVVLSSQCLNFAAWVVTLCLNSSSTILVPLLLHIVFSFQPPTNLGSSNLTSHSPFLIYSYLFSTALSFV